MECRIVTYKIVKQLERISYTGTVCQNLNTKSLKELLKVSPTYKEHVLNKRSLLGKDL